MCIFPFSLFGYPDQFNKFTIFYFSRNLRTTAVIVLCSLPSTCCFYCGLFSAVIPPRQVIAVLQALHFILCLPSVSSLPAVQQIANAVRSCRLCGTRPLAIGLQKSLDDPRCVIPPRSVAAAPPRAVDRLTDDPELLVGRCYSP